MKLIGLEEEAAEPRFATNADRTAHRTELRKLIEDKLAGWDGDELSSRLLNAGVPCGPVNTIDQVFAEPQAKHRGLEVEQARPDLSAPVRTVASPIRMSKTPVSYDRPPPGLGEHTDEVLGPARSRD